GKRRELVIVVDEILGGIDAECILAWHAQLLCSLRANREYQRRWAEAAQCIDRYRRIGTNRHVAEVMNIGQRKHFLELLAQTHLHLIFDGIDAVLGEAAGLDVSIENDGLMPGLSDLLRGK